MVLKFVCLSNWTKTICKKDCFQLNRVCFSKIGIRFEFDEASFEDIPKIIAVQAANCAPLANAFLDGSDKLPDSPSVEFEGTVAEGIEIAEPVRGNQILEAVGETNGSFLTVTEKEIAAALLEVGKKGFYIEPTSAATIAGLKKYIDSDLTSGDEISSKVDSSGGW